MKPFNMRVPKDVRANREYRSALLRHAAGSAEARSYLWDACRTDILFYFNVFWWTYDPRLPGDKVIPFVTFPFQDTAILRIESAIHHGHDLVIEKGRDKGASWFCMGVIEKRWHFHRDQSFLCISRTEEKVDRPGDRASLFGKIDFAHKYMPPWLLPRGYPGLAKGKTACRSKLSYLNPEADSTIIGSATVGAASVGDRLTGLFVDELSRIEGSAADEIDLGSADAADCRIFAFTAYGEGNAADRLRRDPAKRKLRLPWWVDPRMNRGMYQWDGEVSRFRYFECDPKTLELVECAAPEYGEWADDTKNVPEGAAPKKFVPVRDGKLRSPRYDVEATRRGNPRWMAINWEIDYAGSDDKFFDMLLIRELEAADSRPPSWEGDVLIDEGSGELLELVAKPNGPLKLWCRLGPDGKPPPSERGYGGGTDVSLGRGQSNSCLSVADADTGHKVAEYVTPHYKPEAFAARCVAIGNLFRSRNDVAMLLAWEKQGPGESFKDKVFELLYTQIYYTATRDDSAVASTAKKVPGWLPTPANRAVLFEEYESALRQRRFTNRSMLALRECADFIREGPGCFYKYTRKSNSKKSVAALETSGADSTHGDRVTADALANRTMTQLGRPNFGKDEEEDQDPANQYGSLAWRIKMYKRQKASSYSW